MAWRSHVDLDKRARRGVTSQAMRWGVRNRGRVLRGILPLLALIWATATWHDCYLEGMRGATAATAAAAHCAHHGLVDVAVQFALDLPVDDAAPSCAEVADVGPDLRPAPPEMLSLRSVAFVPAAIDADPLTAGARLARATSVPPDRPLLQRPARLLI